MMLFDEVFCVCRIKIKIEIKIVLKNFLEVHFCRNVTCNNPNSYFFPTQGYGSDIFLTDVSALGRVLMLIPNPALQQNPASLCNGCASGERDLIKTKTHLVT